MKPKTFVGIVGVLVAFVGTAATQNVWLLGIGFLIMAAAWWVKWPGDDTTDEDRRARRDERCAAWPAGSRAERAMREQDATSLTVFGIATAALAVMGQPWPYWALVGAAAIATAVVAVRARHA